MLYNAAQGRITLFRQLRVLSARVGHANGKLAALVEVLRKTVGPPHVFRQIGGNSPIYRLSAVSVPISTITQLQLLFGKPSDARRLSVILRISRTDAADTLQQRY